MSARTGNGSPLRFGLIGLGQHGRLAVVPALTKEARRVALAAVADVDPANLAQAEVAPGVGRHTDYRELLRRDDIDAVFVATLADTHAEITVAALEAGKHVVCEKPMAGTVAECRQMVEAARRTGGLLVIDFEMRVYPHFRQIRRWIKEGLLGELHAVHLQRMWDGHKAFGPQAERRGRLIRHAGALDCGIHDLDLVRFFAGGRWQSLRAMGAWFGEAFELPPHISVVGRLDNGVLANVNASFTLGAQIKPRPMNDFTVVAGTRGAVQYAIAADSLEEFKRPGEVSLVSEDRSERITLAHPPHTGSIALLADEVAAIAAGETTLEASGLATGEDGLIAQEAVDEANRQAVQEASARALVKEGATT